MLFKYPRCTVLVQFCRYDGHQPLPDHHLDQADFNSHWQMMTQGSFFSFSGYIAAGYFCVRFSWLTSRCHSKVIRRRLVLRICTPSHAEPTPDLCGPGSSSCRRPKNGVPLEPLITFNRKEKSEDKYGTVITRRLRDAPALLPIVKESSLTSFYVIEPRSSKSSKICGLFFSLSRKALVEICSMG